MKYVLVDVLNLFFRIRHTASRGATIDDKLGISIHGLLSSANKAVKRSNAEHVIFAVDGHSWRKEIYEPYKKTRADARQARTETEKEEDELFFEVLNMFISYLEEKTNCSVIKEDNAEADDIIARWIHLHQEDEHVIVSSDTDFYQLINERVSQYNGITQELITLNGIFNDKGNEVIDKKTGEPKQIGDPEWLLFEKCIRGDKSDNIFSAFPGVRKKGTKNKVGLLEAFADKNDKGFNWNNLMLQRFVDHKGNEHKVIDDYNRNKLLIDLSAIPDNIKDVIDLKIVTKLLSNNEDIIKPNKINFHFMKFCALHELVNLAKFPDDLISWMSNEYKGELING